MSTITRCPCNFAFSRIDHMIALSPTLSALSRSFPAFRRFDYQVTRYWHFRTILARLPHLTDDFPMVHAHQTQTPRYDPNLPALTPCIPLPFRHISLSAHVFLPTVEHFPCHYQRLFDSTTHLPKKLQFITHFPRSWNTDTGQRVIGIPLARNVSTNRVHHVITGQALRTSMVGFEVRVLRD